MSHFTVLVIGPNVDEQLAPYDEDIEVPPYKQFWDTEQIKTWEEILAKDGALPAQDEPYSMEQIVTAFNGKYALNSDDSDKCHLDEQAGIYEWTTYNPKSKWDWYQIGGRWRGYFKLKVHESEQERWNQIHDTAVERGVRRDEAVEIADKLVAEERVALLGPPGTFDNDARYDADVVRKGDVDLEYMRYAAGQSAGEAWDRAHAVIDPIGTDSFTNWTDFTMKVTMKEMEIGAAREAYHAQPLVQAIEQHDRDARHGVEDAFTILDFGQSLDEYLIPRDEYVQRARDAAVAPFAYVIDGKWHETGKMGWFGMSTDTEGDRARFAAEFNRLLDSLPEDTLLTLVDCHI